MERKLKVVGGLPAKLFFKVMPFFLLLLKVLDPSIVYACHMTVATLTLREVFQTETDVTEDGLGLCLYIHSVIRGRKKESLLLF